MSISHLPNNNDTFKIISACVGLGMLLVLDIFIVFHLFSSLYGIETRPQAATSIDTSLIKKAVDALGSPEND